MDIPTSGEEADACKGADRGLVDFLATLCSFTRTYGICQHREFYNKAPCQWRSDSPAPEVQAKREAREEARVTKIQGCTTEASMGKNRHSTWIQLSYNESNILRY